VASPWALSTAVLLHLGPVHLVELVLVPLTLLARLGACLARSGGSRGHRTASGPIRRRPLAIALLVRLVRRLAGGRVLFVARGTVHPESLSEAPHVLANSLHCVAGRKSQRRERHSEPDRGSLQPCHSGFLWSAHVNACEAPDSRHRPCRQRRPRPNRVLKNTLLGRDRDVPLANQTRMSLIRRSRARPCAGLGALRKGRRALFQQPATLGRPAIRDLEAQWATGWAALATARPTGTGRPPGRNLKIRSWATMTFQDASLNLPGCRRGTPGET